MFDFLRCSLRVFALTVVMIGGVASAEGIAGPAPAAEIRHPVVPGFERFHTGDDPAQVANQVEGGLMLLGELGCTSCHAPGATLASQVVPKQAPILDKVGTRVRPAYLRAFLSDPQAVKPGTTMPHLLAAKPAEEKAATVEALVHFLAASGSLVEKAATPRMIPNGKKLYHQIGCVACHGRRDQPTLRLAASMPLGELASKYTIASLAAFLQDPLKVRPSGRMPALNLVKNEAAELANYLLEDLKTGPRPNLTYHYYEGEWKSLPDFNTLTPKASGRSAGFDLSVAKRPDNMALRFEGFLQTTAAGEYTFHLTSDDGSKLFIDDALVIDNDGIHAPTTKSGKIELIKGPHRLVAGVFNAGSEADLDVEYEGRGLARQSVLSAITLEPEAGTTTETANGANDRFPIDGALVEKGRELFAKVGCASCHTLRDGGKPIVSTLIAPPLDRLSAEPGDCVELSHAATGLLYRLSDRERDALIAVIKAVSAGPLPAPTSHQVVTRTMTRFNCYACHQRQGLGGVEEARQEFFKTTQKEMGDEGRIPPSLDGVGAKLQPDYMKKYFDSGVKDRPYMLTRMPAFGALNLTPLIEAFATLDPLEPVAVPTFAESARRVKSIGRFLAGGEALGCIKCHTFKGIESEGVQAVDMAVLTRRLRRDWFHRYLVDTQAYRPGTRMPTAWPRGETMLPQVADGDTRKQIEAVWEFLSDGSTATEPYGLGREPMPLVPGTEAIIYRNFIKGAGPRAIGVGYPEHVNLAFDANELRLALLWQGAFIDASRHWSGRGGGFQPPLGDNVLSLAAGPDFAFLPSSKPAEPWPTGPAKALGDTFRGYRLTADGRPTFLYEVGGLHITDFSEVVPGANPKTVTLRRTLTVKPGERPSGRVLVFRAVAARRVDSLGEGWYAIDGEWKLRVQADGAPLLRTADGMTELRVPVTTSVVQEFVW